MLHRDVAADLTVCSAGRNLGKFQHVGLLPKRGTQLFEKKKVSQRNPCYHCIAAKRRRAANVGTKIHSGKAREQSTRSIEKTEIAILNANPSNFRSHCQSRCLCPRRPRSTGDSDLSWRRKS